MNATEETVVFKHELGYAIAQWGYVEGQLLRIVLECVAIPERPAFAITYHSIENFRSKLNVCDNLVTHKFSKSPAFQKWRSAKDRTSQMAAKRNKIAHGWHRLYINNAAGRRWAIVPLHHADGELLHADGEKPPSGAICLRDLAIFHLEFHALTTQLCNVHEMLCGRPAPFPESDEQPKSPPTLRQLTNQIRVELGFPQKPSRKKS
ncbi:hypothetical protein [Viridibacterium curvum]|uniref:HNH endonuclease n=1 Tax=Viridibacterium curvum TaxID=1101404 RepID=A0ABP9QHQ4_9RHOO